jgi:hypothetical protein
MAATHNLGQNNAKTPKSEDIISMNRWGHTLFILAISLPGAAVHCQTTARAASPFAASAPIPPAIIHPTAAPIPSRTFHDPSYKVSFDYPANWTFARKDGEISTFHLDARSAVHKTSLRAVTAIPENPYPASTFSGAYVYLSVTPHSSDASCARQAEPPPAAGPAPARPAVSQIAGVSFTHGHDEQKHICICGGAVSGVKDISKQELDDVRGRMEAIMGTVRFDPK